MWSMEKKMEQFRLPIGVRSVSSFMAIFVILSVALFGDVMYVVQMQKVLNDPMMLALAYMGAFTSILAVGYILIGKTLTFYPGVQMIAAWVFFGAEIVIIILNVLLAFQGGTGVDQIMQAWATISPATPVFHMLGVAILYFLDPHRHDYHQDLVLERQIADSERRIKLLEHHAQMSLKEKQVVAMSRALNNAVNSEVSQRHIDSATRNMNTNMLIELTGQPAWVEPGTEKIVEPVKKKARRKVPGRDD